MIDDEMEMTGGEDEFRLELCRLVACYQVASRDDQNVVWAAMNKYMPLVEFYGL